MEDDYQQLIAGLEQCGVAACSTQIDQILTWLAMLERWNRTFNLTAIKPSQRIVQIVLMSLAIIPYLRGKQIVDVGSGAGIPGVPLAIFAPHYAYTLVDSKVKKTRFIKQAKLELKLNNLCVEQTRVEQLKGRKYDTIIARGFAGLREFIDVTHHLATDDSRWLTYKGAESPFQTPDYAIEGMSGTAHPLVVPGLKAPQWLLQLHRK